MKRIPLFHHAWPSAAPGILLLSFACSAVAQQPVLSAAIHPGAPRTHAALHSVGALQTQPESAAAEEPQTPPTPPTPGAPVKDDLFAGTERFAKGATEATEVNMDPDSLSLVGGKDSAKARRTVLSVVRTYSYDKPGMYNMADVNEFRQRLNSGDWHCSVHTRDMKTGESTDICRKRRGSDMVEDAIITVEPKSLTFIHTIRHINGQGGHMDLDMDMPGSVSMLGGLPPNMAMLALGPAMRAEMLAEMAGLRATMPQLQSMLPMLHNFHFRFDIPSPSAAPEAPKAPAAPSAPAAPQDPTTNL